MSSIPTKDRACFNCAGYGQFTIPADRDEPKSMYKAVCVCRKRGSDHYLHLVLQQHVCSDWNQSL